MTTRTLAPTDPRVTNPQVRRIHNVTVVQSRQGWTKEDAYRAITDADHGIVYARPVDHVAVGRK
jgi:hypothetical protein